MEEKTLLEKLASPLCKEDIELRVGSVFQKGFTLLLYKTARTDVRRLNDVCGVRWKNRHYYDDEKLLCCEISIYDSEIKEWVGRSDVGTESNTEKEKGHYSDSFKRAGFKWGIGIELYNSPFTFILWETEETNYNGKKQYKLKNFYPAELDISEYKVENGFPFYTLTYKGKEVWSNIKQANKDQTTAYDGNPKDAGFKNAAEAKRVYADKLEKLKAIDTIGKWHKAEKAISEFVEQLSKFDSQSAISFQEEVDRKRKELGVDDGFIDDEVPDFT